MEVQSLVVHPKFETCNVQLKGMILGLATASRIGGCEIWVVCGVNIAVLNLDPVNTAALRTQCLRQVRKCTDFTTHMTKILEPNSDVNQLLECHFWRIKHGLQAVITSEPLGSSTVTFHIRTLKSLHSVNSQISSFPQRSVICTLFFVYSCFTTYVAYIQGFIRGFTGSRMG